MVHDHRAARFGVRKDAASHRFIRRSELHGDYGEALRIGRRRIGRRLDGRRRIASAQQIGDLGGGRARLHQCRDGGNHRLPKQLDILLQPAGRRAQAAVQELDKGNATNFLSKNNTMTAPIEPIDA